MKWTDLTRTQQNLIVGSYFQFGEDRDSNVGTICDIIAALNNTAQEKWAISRQDIVEWFDGMEPEYQADEVDWVNREIARLNALEEAT